MTWNLMTAPWFVFTLQYTGARPAISRRLIVALTVPVLLVPLRVGLQASPVELPPAITGFTATVVFAYVLSLVASGCYLLFRQNKNDARFSLQQGLSLSAIPIGSFLLWNLSTFEITATAMVVVFDAGTITVCAGLAGARYRYGLFNSIPAVGTLGEEALIKQTDDLMFVVDADEQVIQSNRIVVEKLDTTRSELLNSKIDDVIGYEIDEIVASETITLETSAGVRQYDSQLSAVTSPHGNRLGSVLSFRDVSDREISQQRLSVLNRVLRHNLRNRMDIVKSHAEALPSNVEEHSSSIIGAADDVVALSQQAKQIDQFVSAQESSSQVDLTQVVEAVLDRLSTTDVTVTTDMPETAMIATNRGAATSAIESALENAVNYAASSAVVTITTSEGGYCVIISDDGPGIPVAELDALDRGTEDPLKHTTGLGLWQLKLAVMALNGDVLFEIDNGTAVRIDIPDNAASEIE
ncbi:ATP-binding protein [Halorubrum ezzemoulense]|uniref:ATP-binding protein n=1 Tax=Halorubrum ezzemoulense TaxID=337243 RepID=UPI00232F853B|nr:ATP-binding protein [Halorubrum ezzemoulense]